MMKRLMIVASVVVMLIVLNLLFRPESEKKDMVRFATYNCALNRSREGALMKELIGNGGNQLQHVAAVIRHTRPDVLALMEFDYDAGGEALQLFQERYLMTMMDSLEPLYYPYSMVVPSNTGVAVPYDLNRDGKVSLPDDAQGFGAFPGQYAFAVLSRYPLDSAAMRSFRNFLWRDMPGALINSVEDEKGAWYSDGERDILRLSSKNHIDLPVLIGDKAVHLLLSHPTPPVFDGVEDRNGKRNYDEIRLWADYISGDEASQYIVDDRGCRGGLSCDCSFVIMGDMNADPVDGDSYQQAIVQLLDNWRVNRATATGEMVPVSSGAAEYAYKHNKRGKGDVTRHTNVFGLRIDYVLPSVGLQPLKSGVFWPGKGEAGREHAVGKVSSDHRLVWVDVAL